MSLQSLMQEIKKIKPMADGELSEEPRNTYTGRSARQRKAKEDLTKLIEQYRVALLQSAVFVLVTGTGRDAFTKIANDDFGFFKVDAEQFYKDIALQISPQLYDNREASPGLLDVISRVLENKALEVGISGYPMVTFRQEFRRIIKGRSELQALIKQVISTQVGTEVVGAQAIKTILNDAITAELSGKTVPILFSLESIDASLVEGLRRISHRVGVVTVDTDALSSKEASDALNDLKMQMGISTAVAKTFVFGSEESVSISDGVLTQEIVEDAMSKVHVQTEEFPQVTRRNKNKNKQN